MSLTQEHWFRAPNPLTAKLPNWQSVGSVAAALRNDPLANLDLASLSLPERHELLVGDKMPLFPTTRSLKAAMTMLGMHRHSLRVRSPAIAEGRRNVEHAVDGAAVGLDFCKAPPAPGASLLVLKGMSGTAKTVTAKLALERLIGPQVIFHGPEPSSLFLSATQINWLFLAMSHDGSRGGLLTGVLLAIDRALGTTHAIDLPPRFKSVERLAGAVIALLHTYYTGILVIDEIQLLNLLESQHAELMQLFLLNLANSGIPLVLIGNPFGFTWLSELSQNLTRFVERPQIFFHPSGALDNEEDEWPSVSAGVLNYYVLEEPIEELEACRVKLKVRSGGIARLALSLWCGAQANALFDGRRAIGPQDIEDAYADESFDLARPLVDGFARRDPAMLLPWRYVDIPVDMYAEHWGEPFDDVARNGAKSSKSVVNAAASGSTGAAKKRSPSAAALLKRVETTASNRKRRREEVAKTIGAGDMRSDGIKQHTLDSLDELMRQVQADGGHRPAPR